MSKVDQILQNIKKDKIEVLEYWFVDLLGSIKSVEISVDHKDERLVHLLKQGILCDVASLIPSPLTGNSSYKNNYQNVQIIPDLTSYLVLPWTIPNSDCQKKLHQLTGQSVETEYPSIAKARFLCDIADTNHSCFSSRQKLKNYLTEINKSNAGWKYIVGPELEFHYLQAGKALDQGSYMETTSDTSKTSRIREATALMCEEIGIKVERHHHEVGKGQQEIDFVKAEALEMADNIVTYKLIARDVARLFGVHASFMPKPFNNAHGNGMHVHQSIWHKQKNLFYAEDQKMKLSLIGRQFTAGLLAYCDEITAVTNQWVNSYKRIVPSFEAPVYIAWGSSNRSSLIRIPRHYPATEELTRIEYRSPDPACNPYLAFLVMLAAGMKGIENNLGLPAEVAENIHIMPDQTLKDRNIDTLPTNLGLALSSMKKGTIVKEKLGDQFMNDFIKIKTAEWQAYNHHISTFEIDEMRRFGI